MPVARRASANCPLRGAIESHGGFLFSRTSDGVVAAFASPKSAVDAAIAAQRALSCRCGWASRLARPELRDG